MRHIILEGPDNSGKSTLAKFLSQELNLPVVHSGGPSMSPGEIEQRAKKYLELTTPVIFDRHPCVSQNIYVLALRKLAMPAPHSDLVSYETRMAFYNSSAVLIYCQSRGTMEGHVLSEHATEDYAKQVDKHYTDLCRLYDDWGLAQAHLLYRIGDGYETISGFLRGLI